MSMSNKAGETVGFDREKLMAQIQAQGHHPDAERRKPVPPANPVAEAPPFRVRVAQPQGYGETKEYVFSKARTTFGRAEDNDVVLESPTGTLSRHHFEIRYDDGAYWLVDLYSRNATAIEGRRLRPAERYVLLEGDTLEVGDVKVTFLGRVRRP